MLLPPLPAKREPHSRPSQCYQLLAAPPTLPDDMKQAISERQRTSVLIATALVVHASAKMAFLQHSDFAMQMLGSTRVSQKAAGAVWLKCAAEKEACLEGL